MIESNDYWIIENKIIFKPEFNLSLSTYDKLLCEYNELVFSDYNNVIMCVETTNKYSYNYNMNYKKSLFNKIKLNRNNK